MTNSPERPQPYVGVSGVITPEQQRSLEKQAAQTGLLDTRQLLLGIKATHKTQFIETANKYGPEWYPIGEHAFTNALAPRSAQDARLAIVQAYLDLEYVGNPGYRDYFTDRIFHRGKQWIDGIQFDMLPWHTQPELLDFLTKLKEKHATKILLQVHQPAMTTLSPTDVAEQLGEYASTLDYVLFDASHGTGKQLDAAALVEFLDAAYSDPALAQTGFAIAGGLTAQVVRDELPALLATYPDLSWDADGQLHPIKNDGTRPLNMQIAKDYLRASADVIKS